jgi:hypothetical protein
MAGLRNLAITILRLFTGLRGDPLAPDRLTRTLR